MSEEEEQLGNLAYEAYVTSEYSGGIIHWSHLPAREQRAWIASAKAVATHIMQELQCANEASGA